MILPVVAQNVMTRFGWRQAYLVLGVMSLLLGLPLSWRYIRERGSVQRESAPVEHSGKTWQQGMAAFPFWIIVAVLVVSAISMNGAITQMSALLTDRGITATRAALCTSLLGGMSLLGRVGTGWLLDRFFGGRPGCGGFHQFLFFLNKSLFGSFAGFGGFFHPFDLRRLIRLRRLQCVLLEIELRFGECKSAIPIGGRKKIA